MTTNHQEENTDITAYASKIVACYPDATFYADGNVDGIAWRAFTHGREETGPCGPDADDRAQALAWLAAIEDAGYTVAR
ncbi:MAG: hypothetical protein E6Q97_12745 [Desulfurellales bacterium]|nr:MAG: hypothetical protein E6Q97_12745 [Desulfurellales bacterium]